MRGRHRKDDDEVAVVSGDDGIQTSAGSEGAAKWKCLACGAFNDDSDQVCSDCSAMRAGAQASAKPSAGSGSDFSDWETPSTDKADTDEPEEPEQASSDTDSDTDTDNDFSSEPQLEAPSAEPYEEASPPVVSSPIEPPAPTPPPTPSLSPSFTPSYTPGPSSSQASGDGRYYLVFVNSPAPSIIKSKVSIDFENFPTISIGRNPENVVVIPDQEVSRKHAELSLEGGKIIIRDLQSKNGTFVYNGKTFEKVSDSAEVKPNTLLKFGTGTIVRLTVG